MRYLIIFVFLYSVSCGVKQQGKFFIGYPQELLYKGNFVNGMEQSVFEFSNKQGIRVRVGNYLNGFRNEKWYYNIDDSLIEIKWAHFHDKNLGFETNIFAIGDTAYYGDYYTKIDYTIGDGKLSFGVSINPPFKDSVAIVGYKNVAEQELKSINFTISSFDSSALDSIKIYRVSGVNIAEQKEIYSNVGLGRIGNNHIQITLVSNKGVKKQYNDIFFEGVLTNLFYNSKRLYNPFQQGAKK